MVIAVTAAMLFGLPLPLFASSQTITALAVTASSAPVNSVTPGTVITLTATVVSGSTPVTLGTINFCDATALSCSDIHLLGTAQLTGNGTATTRFRPPVGTHSYKAVFTGTRSYISSVSTASSLLVPGTTATTLAVTGVAGNYTLTGSVAASGVAAPTSALSFQDITNGSYVLAAPSLSRGTSLSFTNSSTTFSRYSGSIATIPAVADFNLDGIPDIAIPDNANSVAVLLGNGDGTFTAAATVETSYSYATTTVAIAGDFNGDGYPDLAVICQSYNTLTILLGHGDGTFTASAAKPATGKDPVSMTTGDFDGDGRLDLAVTNYMDGTLTVLLGNGDGTFTAAPTIPSSTSPDAIVAADFNGDGNLDLAVSYRYYGAGCANVFLGKGDGTFTSTPALTQDPSPSCTSIAAADVNRDGHLDLVAADYDNSWVYTFLGAGNGTFPNVTSGVRGSNNAAPTGMAVGDFNGDGLVDYATVSNVEGAITLGLGKGNGSFVLNNTVASTPTYSSESIVAADLTGSGLSDLAVQNGTHALISLLSSASQTFQATLTNVSPAGSGTHQIQAVYPGDTAYSASTSTPVSLTAQPVATTLSLTVSPPNGNNYSQQILLSASLVPYTAQGHATDGETVTFYSGSTAVGTATLANGYASLNVTSLPAGPNSLKAVYNGDTNLAGSTSAIIPYSVTYATTLSLAVTPVTASYGQHVTLTATLVFNGQSSTTNGETVTFKNGASTLGTATLSSGVASFTLPTLPVSTANLSAYYGGDASVAAVTSNSVALAISKATPTLTWAPPATSAVFSGTYVGSALFNASSNTAGNIAYTATTANGSPLPISAYTIFSAGSYTLTATLTPADAADYASASTTSIFLVTPAPLTVVPQNATRIYGEANAVFLGSVTGALRGDYFTVTGSTTATTASGVGNYPITYTVAGTDLANYAITQATGTLAITSAAPNLTWSPPATIPYGTALSAAQLNATSPTPGSFAYTPALGTILPAGLQTLSVIFTPTDTTNYSTQTRTVPLALSKATLSLTADNFARVFGTANPSLTGTVSGAVNGDAFTESFITSAALTSIVGSYPIVPSVAGANLANYTVKSTSGSLTVSQAGTATSLLLSNANLTLSATIAALNTGTPTGSVAFYEGQTLVGTGTLVNGSASYTTGAFPAGDVVVTAAYSGDANFTQSASPPVLVLTVQAAQTQLSVAPAGSTSDTLALSAAPGFTGSVQFSCTGLPQYATCSFSPSSVTFGTAATATTTVTIQTGVMASLVPPARMRSQRGLALAALFCFPGLGLAAFSRRRRLPRLLSTTFVSLFAIALCASLTACGTAPQSGSTGSTPIKSATGAYNVEVISIGSGGLSQTTSLALSVQ